MILKRNQIFNLNSVLSGINFGKKLNSRFRFMVHSNVELTQLEVDATNKTFSDSDEIIAFRAARLKIAESYGVKSESDAAKLDPSELDKMNAEIQTLMDANADVIEATEDLYAERDEFMRDDVDIALKTVELKNVPEIPIIKNTNHWGIWGALRPVITCSYAVTSVNTTRKDLIDLHSVLLNAQFDVPISNKFRYMVMENIDLIQTEISNIDSKYVLSDAYVDYREGRKQLVHELNVDSEDAYNKLSDDEKADIDKQLLSYDDEHKTLIADAVEFDARRNEYLNEDIKFSLYAVENVDELPVLSEDNEINEWLIFKLLTIMVKEK